MKSIRIAGAGPRAVVAVIGLAIAAFAYADAQGSAGAQIAVSANSRHEVEAEIVRAGLVGKMETSLGDAFGGAWFDPPTAQLHVGVTSTESRQTAEAVAAQAGLAGSVVETPVGSTWQQLVAAQEEWSHRLDDLFARAEVATALRARYNSVEVELGSKVPSSRRAALEREAAAADVGVTIASVSAPHIRLERDGRCKAFATGKAYCDPTIVGGVTIRSENGEVCTAGPAVVPEGSQLKPTGTYILTAGHCIENAGGAESKWFAFPKNATMESEKKEIGKAIEYTNAEPADVGLIKVDNPGFWAKEGFIPVEPGVALWTGAESEPTAVTGEEAPAEGFKSCMSGQTSGTSCGKILKLGVELEGTIGLVEVGATRAPSDSGAPWYYESSPGLMEGTHVGHISGNAVFEPLKTTIEQMSTQIELLNESGKIRHPFRFISESAPVTLTGKQHAGSSVFTTTVGATKCTEGNYSGSLSAKEVIEFEMTQTYAGCTVAGLSGSVDVNGCKLRFRVAAVELSKREGRVDIVCPSGKEMTVTATVAGVNKCTIHVPPQTALETETYTNIGAGATREVTVDVKIVGIKYSHTAGTGVGKCTGGSAEDGTLETSIAIKAENALGTQVGFFTE